MSKGLTRSVAMIFGSADPSASIPISVGPATCIKRSMAHIKNMIFKEKPNLVNTTSSKELPLGFSHKLISRAHCEIFCFIPYITFVLKDCWFLQQLFALKNLIPMRSASKPVNKPKARAAIPWENESKGLPQMLCLQFSPPNWDLNSSKSKDMRGAGIFEGVQCCRVDLSRLFADDSQSDRRPKNFHNNVRKTHLVEQDFDIMMIHMVKVFCLVGEGDKYIHDT